jgi:glycosyltransferase involved in cell wall biosynthesis
VTPRISVVINTLEEERNIADCIASVRGLAEEVLVADMGSSDRTADLARALGASVHVIPRAPFADPSRNRAIALASGDWVLILDADERLTPALASRLRAIAESDGADVVEISFKTHMFGHVIRYCGWQDTSRKTFFKKGFLTYPETEVHSHAAWSGRLLVLPRSEGEIVHYNYRDVGHFLRKLRGYTDGEALKLLRAGGRVSPLRGLYWGGRQFLRRYLLRSGWRDGGYGLLLCLLMGYYWYLAFYKAWKLAAASGRPGGGAA